MFDFITDGSFDIEKTKQYLLSIQVSLDGFSFLVIHPSEKRVVAFKSTPLKISSDSLLARRLNEWLESEVLLKNQFSNVSLFVYTENFTIFPVAYSGNELKNDLTSALFNQNSNHRLIENKIEHLNATLIFSLPIEIIEVFQLFFYNTEIIHPVTKLLQRPIESAKRNSAVIISTKKYFFLIITRNNRLLLANSYQATHQNDLVYNVLNTFQQLELARSETELFVADTICQNTEIGILLKPFFETIGPLKTDGLVANPEIINQTLQLYLTQI